MLCIGCPGLAVVAAEKWPLGMVFGCVMQCWGTEAPTCRVRPISLAQVSTYMPGLEAEPLAGLNGGVLQGRSFICFSLCSVIVTHILFGVLGLLQCCPGLSPAQHSGITSSGVQWIIWGAGIKHGSVMCSSLPFVVLPP